MSCQSSYLSDALVPRRAKIIVDTIKKVIGLYKIEFDTIAFRGMSGALIAPTVAMELGKELLMVRKKQAEAHSSYMVEGNIESNKYIIIDDLIASGATIRNTVFTLDEEKASQEAHGYFVGEMKCVGIILYRDTRNGSPSFLGDDGEPICPIYGFNMEDDKPYGDTLKGPKE